jgi:hypothetical protein
LEFTLGKGRVLFLASTWSPKDSQLALSSKFVPLLYSILRQSGPPSTLPTQFFVGDSIPMDSFPSGTVTVSGPGVTGNPSPPDSKMFTRTALPGLYAATSGTQTRRFAVNVDPAESRTAVLARDELERLGAPMSKEPTQYRPAPAERQRLRMTEQESRQKLWRWLILGAVVVVLAETWLAGRTLRSSRPLGATRG